ncbi:hypothetical protein A9179_05925 [Pseudomonas alcaligenes]|uniref:DUF2939 domain-containing protein n=1 Tax=Aquipseudomonas alcaligenes TaxID=43263 RepID=A0ABR7RYL3_AQUAC|nr:hypothetical protein [Pseudomonas alcaligenes]MBC9249809.1 hypothetical protein [Pseudomonas alcaligenes]
MKRRLLWAGGLLLVPLLAGGGWLWLKAEYRNEAAIEVASTFLRLLQEERPDEAFELALARGGLLSRDRQQFSKSMDYQLCSRRPLEMVWTHPPQSRGNRLRRWLAGTEVEMPSFTVHFDGACPISVELRRDAQGRWRVFNFQSTAG